MNQLVNLGNTMTTIALLSVVNQARTEAGEKAIRNADFLEKVADELDGEHYGKTVVQNLNNTETVVFELTIDQCALVGMRESKTVRRKVLAKLKELETPQPIALPSYAEALRGLADQIEATARVTLERDTAIATKALIGSKREATAMATASSAVKKASHLANELGRGAHQATMIAVEKANGCAYGKQGFRPLKKWCKANDITAAKVPCPRYGEASAWPAAAWLDVYGVDLAGLFGGGAQ